MLAFILSVSFGALDGWGESEGGVQARQRHSRALGFDSFRPRGWLYQLCISSRGWIAIWNTDRTRKRDEGTEMKAEWNPLAKGRKKEKGNDITDEPARRRPRSEDPLARIQGGIQGEEIRGRSGCSVTKYRKYFKNKVSFLLTHLRRVCAWADDLPCTHVRLKVYYYGVFLLNRRLLRQMEQIIS